MVDTVVTYTTNHINIPYVDAMILDNVTVQAEGNSEPIYVGGLTHLELLVNVGVLTGVTDITFHITVLGGDATTVIRTYGGVQLSASLATDYILIDSLLTGTYVKVTWTSSTGLDATHKFANVYAQFIAK